MKCLGLRMGILAAALASAESTVARPACAWVPSAADTAGAEVLLQVRCDDEPEGIRYHWDFGDGDTTLTARPAARHAYARSGSFEIMVQVRVPGDFPLAVPGLHHVLLPLPSGRPSHAASILFDSARSRVWAVNPDNHSVVRLDWPSRVRSPEITVGRRPRSLALAPDGSVWVLSQDDALLTILDGNTGNTLGKVALPRASHPFGLVIDGRGGFAYVTAQGTGSLLKVGLAGRTVVGNLPVTPTARGLAMTHDGKRIYVTRFLSSDSAGEVVEVDGTSFSVRRRIPLAYDRSPNTDRGGSGIPNAVNAVVLSPDEKRAWVVAKKDNAGLGKLAGQGLLEVENTVRTLYAVLDLERGEEIPALRTDLDNRSMAKAAAFSSRGMHAFVATEGSNTVEILRALGTPAPVSAIVPGLPGRALAPQGLVLHPNDSLLFVQYFTSREIGVFDLSTLGGTNTFARLALIKTVDQDALGERPAEGQRIFYNSEDIRMSKTGYVACATCHMEGGEDGRVWDFTGRGEGLRNTTTLRGKGGTAQGPLHWSANFDEIQDFEHDIRKGQGGTGFLPDAVFAQGTRNTPLGDAKAGLSPELDALAAYVASLARVPASPYRNPDGTLTAAARKGKELFHREDVGCFRCHNGPSFTDSRLPPNPPPPAGPVAVAPGARSVYTAQGFLLHDVGTLAPTSGRRLGDTLPGLDTPTLKGIWATAPYLHDGSAPDLRAVIEARNGEDRHGRTSHLTGTEKAALVDYLLQIDEDEGEAVAARERRKAVALPAAGGLRIGGCWRWNGHDALGRR